jgi:hypothetical protein
MINLVICKSMAIFLFCVVDVPGEDVDVEMGVEIGPARM